MIDDRAIKVRNISETGRDIVKHIYDRSQAGEFDAATAQTMAKEALRKVRYDGVEYFFIYDDQGNCVLLPPKPEREGKNFLDLKDANGVHFIRPVAKVGAVSGFPKAA